MLYGTWIKFFLPTPVKTGPANKFLGYVIGFPSYPFLAI